MVTSTTRRRLVLAGAASVVVGFQLVPRMLDRLSSSFTFIDIVDPIGFRRIADGEVSLAGNLFFGLDGPEDPQLAIDEVRIRALLCSSLFDTRQTGETVRIAFFSDYYCPYCRVLSERLIRISNDTDVQITWHEMPIFGVASEIAAGGAIAAGNQGAYIAYHQRLMATQVRANSTVLDRLADDLGLDVAQFQHDMQSDTTERALRTTVSVSRIFRFIGTPALVVGRSVLQGAITEENLRQLIEIERAELDQNPCA